jgi:hypothetical protein
MGCFMTRPAVAPADRLGAVAVGEQAADSRTRHNCAVSVSSNLQDQRDVFVSHASEDKHDIARPLTDELMRRGYSVWYDEYELVLGDSLRQRIDEGLAESTIGVVILSHSFFAKPWPTRELDGLNARMMGGEKNVIVPVWHELTEQDLLRYSPPLAGLLAGNSTEGINKLADHIERVLARRASNGNRSTSRPTATTTGQTSSDARQLERPQNIIASSLTKPRTRTTPTRRQWQIAGVVLLLALAAPIALFLSEPSATHLAVFRRGRLMISTDQHWHAAQTSLPGVALSDQIAISWSATQIHDGLVSKPAKVAAALPSQTRSFYGPPTSTDVTSLPLGSARRYLWLQSPGHPLLQLLMISTNRGEFIFACSSRAATEPKAALAACSDVTGKSRILGATVEYPGVDPRIASDVARALEPLAKGQAGLLTGLDSTDLIKRAPALVRIAQSEARASIELKLIANARRYAKQIADLAAALTHRAQLTNAIATAAHTGRSTAYASLLRSRSISHALEDRAQELAELGFEIPRLEQIHIPALPQRTANPASPRRQSTIPQHTVSTITSAPAYTTPTSNLPASESQPSSERIVTKPK